MPPSKKNKSFDWSVNEGEGCIVVEEDANANENESNDAGADANISGSTNAKIKCLKCYRVARKDCTGQLCIRCCTDEKCVVHEEQRAKARWKEAVIEGTTEIQRRAKHKRSRVIPKGRFREPAFKYMNDTVVLWDLRTVLEPSPPPQRKHHHQQSSPAKAPGAISPPGRSATTAGPSLPTSSLSSTFVSSAAAMAEYQNALKTREEILRNSRRNNTSSSKNGRKPRAKFRRKYGRTKKRFRSVMEDLYQRSLP